MVKVLFTLTSPNYYIGKVLFAKPLFTMLLVNSYIKHVLTPEPNFTFEKPLLERVHNLYLKILFLRTLHYCDTPYPEPECRKQNCNWGMILKIRFHQKNPESIPLWIHSIVDQFPCHCSYSMYRNNVKL